MTERISFLALGSLLVLSAAVIFPSMGSSVPDTYLAEDTGGHLALDFVNAAYAQSDQHMKSKVYLPPAKQLESGTAINDIQCNKPRELYIRQSQTPVCLYAETYDLMQSRGIELVPTVFLPADIFSPEETEWLENNPVIRVSYDPGLVPIEYLDDSGILQGVTLDYIAEFEAVSGADLVQGPIVETWTDTLKTIKDRESDIMFIVASAPERLEYMSFTSSHYSLKTYMASLNDAPLNIDDDGLVLATIRGYAIESWLDENHPDTQYVSVDNQSEAFEVLQAGGADAFASTWPSAVHYSKLSGVDSMYNAGSTGHQYDLAVGYRNDLPILGSIMQKTLDQIPQEKITGWYDVISAPTDADLTPESIVMGVVDDIIALYDSDPQNAFEQITSMMATDPSYPFVLDYDTGVIVAHGSNPELVNVLSTSIAELDRPFDVIRSDLLEGHTWVKYTFENPTTGTEQTKRSLFVLHDGYIFGSGYYTELAPADIFSPEETEWLENNPVIRVSYDPGLVPIEYLDDSGILQGVTLDYIAEFEAVSGADLVQGPIVETWTDTLKTIKDRESDIMFIVASAPERLEYMSFTSSHYSLKTYMASLNDAPLNIDDDGLVLATIRGYAIESWLDENHPDTQYVSVDNQSEAFEVLQAGGADAFASTWPSAVHYSKLSGVDSMYNAGSTGHQYDLAVGYRNDLPILGSIMQKTLDQIPQEKITGWYDVISAPTDADLTPESIVMGVVDDIIALYDSDPQNAFEQITSMMATDPSYPFVLDYDTGVIVAHGSNPELVNVLSTSIAELDRPFDVIRSDLLEGHTWVKYTFENPTTGTEQTKRSLFVLHDGYIFGSGYYTELAPADIFSPEETEWLENNPVIRVSYDPGLVPIEYLDDSGILQGVTLDYIAEFEAVSGADLVQGPIVETWTDTLKTIKDRESDIMFIVASAPERLEYMSFTSSHYSLKTYMASLNDAPLNIDDDGLVLATIRGYAIESWLDENHPDTQYVSVDNQSEAFEVLQAGGADAFASTWPSAVHYSKLSGVDSMYNAGSTGHQYDLAVGYRNDLPILGSIMQKTLDQIPQEKITGWYDVISAPTDADLTPESIVMGVVDDIIALYDSDPQNAFEQITSMMTTDPHYPFVIDPETFVILAHGANPEHVGEQVESEMIPVQHIAGTASDADKSRVTPDRPFDLVRAELYEHGQAWVEYEYINPVTGAEKFKNSLFVLHDGYIFGSGYYTTQDLIVQGVAEDAIALYKNNPDGAFESINSIMTTDPHYPFVLDPLTASLVAHGANPDRVGDVSVSFTASSMPQDVILSELQNGNVWTEYTFANPTTGEIQSKRSILVLYDGYIFGSGYYVTPESTVQNVVDETIALYISDPNNAFEHINSMMSSDPSYPVVIDYNTGVIVAHGSNPELVNVLSISTIDTDRPFDVIRSDLLEGYTWVKYTFENPATETKQSKHTLLVLHDGYVFASGYYTDLAPVDIFSPGEIK